ncbi:capsule assembly Wzi family protein [Rheinheimera sp. MMS21-TC3]|uniref:capsule assembly Wzi family protein n=1 Tax=Rheinheimera sp. MMS21-TC3 TaxID=3072790 RepID=UPI0028C3C781|nr:capsule assembly Wzi family protein [Rheinheimera sp. MMS21-TC3]WNO61684.1 capsule assembly Wzi family protein [Rheinheimera sp. MMS21-TC3]
MVFFIGCIFLTALYPCQLVASPWVNTDDRYLRTSIKLLADAGYLNIPINTYPLMWQPILAELAKVDRSQLTDSELLAFLRLTSAVNHARTEHIKTLEISAATDSFAPSGFANNYAQRAKIKVGTEFKGNNWALGIVKSFNYKPFSWSDTYHFSADENEAIFTDYNPSHDWQGSYAAVTLGNWVLLATQQQQWWGPGYDTSFNFSHNGPAAKKLRLNRLNSALPFNDSLDFLGNANVSLELGQQAGSALLRHHNFAAARISIKPWSALEVATSLTYHQALDNEVARRLNAIHQLGLANADKTASLSQSQLQTIGTNIFFEDRTAFFEDKSTALKEEYAATTISQLDVRYSITANTAVYAGVSLANGQSRRAAYANNRYTSSSNNLGNLSNKATSRESNAGYLVGAEYNIANVNHQLSLTAELQKIADNYPHWLSQGGADAALVPSEQLLIAVQGYQGNGQASYIHFKQQSFAQQGIAKQSIAQEGIVKQRQTLELGYQQPLFKGLISVDYQLQRQQLLANGAANASANISADTRTDANAGASNINKTKYEHKVALRWEWRW